MWGVTPSLPRYTVPMNASISADAFTSSLGPFQSQIPGQEGMQIFLAVLFQNASGELIHSFWQSHPLPRKHLDRGTYTQSLLSSSFSQ